VTSGKDLRGIGLESVNYGKNAQAATESVEEEVLPSLLLVLLAGLDTE
jgi:hypothetical protein